MLAKIELCFPLFGNESFFVSWHLMEFWRATFPQAPFFGGDCVIFLRSGSYRKGLERGAIYLTLSFCGRGRTGNVEFTWGILRSDFVGKRGNVSSFLLSEFSYGVSLARLMCRVFDKMQCLNIFWLIRNLFLKCLKYQ